MSKRKAEAGKMYIYPFILLYEVCLRLVTEIFLTLPAVDQLFRCVQWVGETAARAFGLAA